jgi:hypothetical protein
MTVASGLGQEEADIVIASNVTLIVTRRLWKKQIEGVKEHGFVLQPGDRRVDALIEAQAEALDLAQYLEKAIQEKDVRWPDRYEHL